MKIRIYPTPRGKYKNIEFDTKDIPCQFEAQNGTVIIEEIKCFSENSIHPIKIPIMSATWVLEKQMNKS
jgi:hypothetical protein